MSLDSDVTPHEVIKTSNHPYDATSNRLPFRDYYYPLRVWTRVEMPTHLPTLSTTSSEPLDLVVVVIRSNGCVIPAADTQLWLLYQNGRFR